MSLSQEERAAIYEYTKERYRDLNYPLNSGADVSSSIQAEIDLLNQALSKLPPIEGVFYRTIPKALDELADYMAKLRKDKKIDFPAFTSTSHSMAKAKKFGGNVLFIITSKAGHQVSELAHYPQEDEVLFMAPTSFLVKNVQSIKINGQIIGLQVYLNDA